MCAGFAGQRLDEVGDRFVAVFETDRQAQQAVADADRGCLKSARRSWLTCGDE